MESMESELYNLQDDPGETMNVVEKQPEAEKQFELLLSNHISNINTEPVSIPKITIEDTVKKRLKMLGYLD